jgi:hypothetical protein
MSTNGEDKVVRFPRSVRERFGFSDDRIVMGKGANQVTLAARKAYREDVRALVEMLKTGKLTDQEAKSVGFVSSSIRKKLAVGPKGSVWVSEGVGSITIGADPEFGLVEKPGNILARGCNILPEAGEFGSDGPGVEVRPAPSSDHLAVVKNIRSILASPPAAVEKYAWQGGATFQDPNRVYWFGGHVHLGRPGQIEERDAKPIYCKIATILDSLLALPLVRFDAPNPQKRRNGCPHGYGKAGRYDVGDASASIRVAREGGRFEYRVLSGLWVTHPTLAKIALGTAKCIAETAYARIAAEKFDLDWAQAPASRKGLLHSFGLKGIREIGGVINRSVPTEVTQEHVNLWKRRIQRLDNFGKYAEELEALMALVEEAPTGFTLDVKNNWRGTKALLPKHETSAKLRKALKAVEEK